MGQKPRRGRWQIPVAAAALAYLVCAVFFPIVGFAFIDFDVTATIIQNPHVRGISGENLQHIFTSRCLTSYYPVRSLTYAIDYELWGLKAGGFKLTNGFIHLVNVYLVLWLALRLLRRLPPGDKPRGPWWDVSLAAFAAALLGVHPVVVEPVTWVPGREELLMTLGALSCLHFHMTARRLAREGDRPRTALACYACAASSCAAACLSNAVAAVIPLLIVTWDVLMLDRPKLRRILYGTSVLWVIGIATIVSKKLVPQSDLPAGRVPEQLGVFSSERLMVVMNVYWLNVKSLFWPRDLGLSYEFCRPRSFLEAGVILGVMSIGLSCALLWKLRRRKTTLFGLLWFVLALGPSSQIIPHHIDRADRFLYLPLAGIAVALATSLSPLASRSKGRAAIVGASSAGILCLFLLVALSASQVQTWRNDLSVWENCVRRGPNDIYAQRTFADNLAKAGHFDRAVLHYQSAIALDPDSVETLVATAWLLGTYEEVELRDYATACRLAERACQITEWEDPRVLECFAVVLGNSAEDLVAQGEFGQAIEHYDRVIQVDPDDKFAVFNLAWLLATCPDEKLRNPTRAVQLAETCWHLAGRAEAIRLKVLAAAYAEAGRLEEAAAATEDAIHEAQDARDAQLFEELRRQRERYESRLNDAGKP